MKRKRFHQMAGGYTWAILKHTHVVGDVVCDKWEKLLAQHHIMLGVEMFRFNPRFYLTEVGRNLGLIRKITREREREYRDVMIVMMMGSAWMVDMMWMILVLL